MKELVEESKAIASAPPPPPYHLPTNVLWGEPNRGSESLCRARVER